MTKSLKLHFSEVEKKEQRITDLQGAISGNQSRLKQLQQQYTEAVASDAESVDNLFYDMDELERKIKADQHKLKTLEAVTVEHLKNSAIKTVKEFHHDVKSIRDEKLDSVKQRVDKLKNKYIQEVEKLRVEAAEVNAEYKRTSRRYWKVIRSHNLTKHDINTGHNQLYTKIEDAGVGVIDGRVSIVYEITRQDFQKEVD